MVVLQVGDPRLPFRAAVSGFLELVAAVGDEQWSLPALGNWDVRALVGHCSRALSTTLDYLGRPVVGKWLSSPADYFVSVLPDPTDLEARREADEAVAKRAVEAAAKLGEDPAPRLAALAELALRAVAEVADDTPVGSPAGNMLLVSYLPTRTFEICVHSLDLARALGLPFPVVLGPAIQVSLELAGAIAARRRDAAQLLLWITGRPVAERQMSVL
jgi:uncharacterized protein (TIGR03083 family)